ncbi:MAG: hypothetical protein QM642_06195 [Edaphocola sp.]
MFFLIAANTLSFSVYAQKNTSFQRVEQIAASSSAPLLVYQYSYWCGSGAETLDSLMVILRKYRSQYRFLVLTDSASFKKQSENIRSLQPDYFLADNSYHNLNYRKAKKLAKNFKEAWGYDPQVFGPGSSFLLTCEGRLKKFFQFWEEDRGDYHKAFRKSLEAELSSLMPCSN